MRGIALRKRRLALDLNAGEVAAWIGANVETLRTWERDNRRVPKRYVALLDEALHLPVGPPTIDAAARYAKATGGVALWNPQAWRVDVVPAGEVERVA